MRDAFGRLLIDPGSLDFPERVRCARLVAGELQAQRSAESRWLGRAVLTWLHQGGDLIDVLGLRPPKGSRRTAQAVVLAERQQSALLQLAVALGSDALALRVLRGEAQCPPRCADLLAEAQALRCPTSKAAITRARKASRHRA